MANLDMQNSDGIIVCTCDDRGMTLQPGDIFAAQIRIGSEMLCIHMECWVWRGHQGYLPDDHMLDFDRICIDHNFKYWVDHEP